MLLWTMDQMRELQLQWARELYWQEGQARGAIRTCKAMGLDFADALQHLQALLPELPQVNAEPARPVLLEGRKQCKCCGENRL